MGSFNPAGPYAGGMRRLGSKTSPPRRPLRPYEKLERDEAAQLGVLGLLDRTHTAAVELFQNAVVGNSRAQHEGEPTFSGILGRRQGQVDMRLG